MRALYNVESYARFRDDLIIVIISSRDRRIQFVREFRSFSTYFKLNVESISVSNAVMLDLSIVKGAGSKRTGFLDVFIHEKP